MSEVKKVRGYVDMVADLFHSGHVRFLQKVKEHCDEVVVGLLSDEVAFSYKREPICTLEERVEMVRACRYVDEVIPNVPLVTTLEFLREHNIDFVAHGDDYSPDQIREFYAEPIDNGMFQVVPYTKGISTTDLIHRCQQRPLQVQRKKYALSIGSTSHSSEDDLEANRSQRWKRIWTRKGETVVKSLHHANGFLQLDDSQFYRLVQILTEKIGIRDGDTVLDCGCGGGAFLLTLQNLYGAIKATGVDFSESLLDIARYHVEGVFLWAELPNLNRFRNQIFKRVVCFSVFFYLNTEEDAVQTLREMYRVLLPGGSIYIGDVSDLDKKELAMEMRRETHKNQEKLSEDNPDHLYLSKSLFINFAEENNMRIEIVDHTNLEIAQFYDTAPYRYSVYFFDNRDE